MASHGRLLIAVQREELFQRFESCIARAAQSSGGLQALHCLPDQVDRHVRDAGADAVIVIEPRFQEAMPAAVRQWKQLRPDLQALFIFRRLPPTRGLVDLMRSGAFDVLDTEIEAIDATLIDQVIADLARRLAEIRSHSQDRGRAREALGSVGLVGEAVETQNLFVQVLHAASLSCAVLISGESGAGKRLVAHAIHALGPRGAGNIVTADIPSLSPALLNLSLFGSPGLSGAPARGPLFAAAENGSLLLNEVSEAPRTFQTQLQRALETETAGAARILSTTSRRMDQLVETRRFRADLLYRLNVLSIEVPPLRRRLQDVPLLARYFLSRFEREGQSLTISDEAMVALGRYHWPGNVRELKDALAYAAARSVDNVILAARLPEAITSEDRSHRRDEPFSSSELNLANLERQVILRALQISGFDKTKAARLLGIGKTTMYRKLKEMSGRK
jgi:DNA-binding NtrC family response regulator